MAIAGGLEPPTHSLEGCCSIQLSYATMPETILKSGHLTESKAAVQSGCHSFLRSSINRFCNCRRAGQEENYQPDEGGAA